MLLTVIKKVTLYIFYNKNSILVSIVFSVSFVDVSVIVTPEIDLSVFVLNNSATSRKGKGEEERLMTRSILLCKNVNDSNIPSIIKNPDKRIYNF